MALATQTDPDRELKLVFINRQKRLFENIYNQLKIANSKGIVSTEQLEEYKSHYNEIVYDDAKKAYLEYKLKYKRKKDPLPRFV
jgi:hypothetical protein